jgi:hypothetical protein
LSNFHDVEDEDDLSIGKEKSRRTYMRKTVTVLEDDHEQLRWFGQLLMVNNINFYYNLRPEGKHENTLV